jgi:exodeoxyribonuclease VII large subunit
LADGADNQYIPSAPCYHVFAMEQMGLQLQPARRLYTVAELNAHIRATLDEYFSDIWVAGEISGVRLASSGHYYFALKDGESQVRCACFRMTARYLKFKPQDGIQVIARGRIDVYESRGEYQLLVDALEPQGYGALQFAFEELKKRLLAEGLFDPARKRPLPKLPRRIGIVTSPAGAVIQDMLNVLSRRFPGVHIRLFPAQVQGEGAVETICRGIRFFSASGWAEVVIVARGGGSLEDLWCFNEETVARTIAGCSVPVISAIGHETDFTIADFAADLRAPTPSAAAELVVCTREQILEQITGCRKAMEQVIRYRLSVSARRLHSQGIDRATTVIHRGIGRSFQRLDEMDRVIAEIMRSRFRDSRSRLDSATLRLRKMDLRLRFSDTHRRLEALGRGALTAITLRLTRARARLEPLSSQLAQLSPVRILDRGYAIVHDNSGRVVKDAAEVASGTALRIRRAKGVLAAEAKESERAG